METKPLEIILRQRPQPCVESKIEMGNGDVADYVGFPQTRAPYFLKLIRRPNETDVYFNDEHVLSLPVERDRQIVVRLHPDELDDFYPGMEESD